MMYSFQAETVLYTLAAIGIVAIVREAWLWLVRRPGRHGALSVVLTMEQPPAAEEMGYILGACDEIRHYYFPGLTLSLGRDGQECFHAERTD